MSAVVMQGDCREVLRGYEDNCVDSVVTDPPYGLSKEPNIIEVLTHWMKGDDYKATGGGFMGKTWDSFVPGPATWKEIFRVLKPGGHLLCFAGSRTVDLMGISLRMAGFEIRDQIQWVYGSGFPKSLDVSKAIDKAAGAEREVVGENPNHRAFSGVAYEGVYQGGNTGAVNIPATDDAKQWAGWGTALKPAHEPIIVARKPLIGTVAANVLAHGTGALNIDGCRIEGEDTTTRHNSSSSSSYMTGKIGEVQPIQETYTTGSTLGRFPANLIHDGSEEVLACFPESKSGGYPPEGGQRSHVSTYGAPNERGVQKFTSSEGSAARFFYCAKASKSDRGEGNNHPTVKPTALMRYLCRLVTPPGGVVLDPFAGSGSTGKAAEEEGFDSILITDEAEHVAIIRQRLGLNRKEALCFL